MVAYILLLFFCRGSWDYSSIFLDFFALRLSYGKNFYSAYIKNSTLIVMELFFIFTKMGAAVFIPFLMPLFRRWSIRPSRNINPSAKNKRVKC